MGLRADMRARALVSLTSTTFPLGGFRREARPIIRTGKRRTYQSDVTKGEAMGIRCPPKPNVPTGAEAKRAVRAMVCGLSLQCAPSQGESLRHAPRRSSLAAVGLSHWGWDERTRQGCR